MKGKWTLITGEKDMEGIFTQMAAITKASGRIVSDMGMVDKSKQMAKFFKENLEMTNLFEIDFIKHQFNLKRKDLSTFDTYLIR
jgi:hypothetical protein